MKNLKDSISEKLSVDSILEKLRIDDIIIEKFPVDGTVDDMIKFLEDNGFNKVYCRSSIDESFNKYKSRCFYKTNGFYLWFGDTSKGKISKENPIFIYRIQYNSFGVYYCSQGDVCWLAGENTKNSKEDREEFLKELNKRFGWR